MKNWKPLIAVTLLGASLSWSAPADAKDKGNGRGHAYGHNKVKHNDNRDNDNRDNDNRDNDNRDETRAERRAERRSTRTTPRRTRTNYKNRGTRSGRIHSTVINGETRYYRIVNGERVYLKRGYNTGSDNNNSGRVYSTVINGETRYYRIVDGQRVYLSRTATMKDGVRNYIYNVIR